MECTPTELTQHILTVLRAGLVPFVKGSPAIGKSYIIRSVAKERNLKLIDVRLSQCDPTDLLGLPFLDKETGKSFYAPPIMFPLESDPMPEGYKGVMVFFDEMNAASPSVQVAAYKIILDRAIGLNKIHDKCVFVCAGNLETDRAIVNRLSTAMQSRLITFTLKVSKTDFLNFAYTNNFDHRVISYIEFRPEMLHKFDPKSSDDTFPAPRTWHFLSRIISNIPVLEKEHLPLLTGTVGEGAGFEFLEYSKIYKKLPTIKQILTDPDKVEISTEPSFRYAISGILSANMNAQNLDKTLVVMGKLPVEFQIITLRGAVKRNKKLISEPAIEELISVYAKELF